MAGHPVSGRSDVINSSILLKVHGLEQIFLKPLTIRHNLILFLCFSVYPAREAEEYCRATGDHYKCNATCAQLSGRGLHTSPVEWPGSQFTEGTLLIVGGLL